MKGESRAGNFRAPPKCPENEKTLVTNLPLIFANGKPVSLDKITLPELEEFIPFMVRCSMGQRVSEEENLNNCATPEWWPKEEFVFSFPLRGPSVKKRLNSLRSLVCRCYTYYDCEFLLKFSSQLSLMPQSSLQYVRNEDSETTCIYDKKGTLLVKFRNENLLYDAGKHPRKHLFPIIQSPSAGAENKSICIDLTALSDDSSEDDKESHHSNQETHYGLKRIRDSSDEETGCSYHKNKKKRSSRRFDKFQSIEMEIPEVQEPTVLNQDGFLYLFGIQRVGRTIENQLCQFETSKARLSKRFLIIPFSSDRGSKILANSRINVNTQHHMDRIERYASSDTSTQICTRTTGVSNLDILDEDSSDNYEDSANTKWVHIYKWPSKCHKPKRMHRGPTLKDCYVKMDKLSEEFIKSFMRQSFKIAAATMTPEEWQDNSVAICDCSLLPVISLIDDDGSRTSDKSCSTRCNCKTGNVISNMHHNPHNLKNNVSNFGNTNISNNSNANRNKNNDSHTKKYFSSTSQKSSLGRTRSNGPVFLGFSDMCTTTVDNSPHLSDEITPIKPLRFDYNLKIKPVISKGYRKSGFTSTSSKDVIVPQNMTDVEKNNSSYNILLVKSTNHVFGLRKRNAPVQWEIRNSREPLQENLIPTNELLALKKRKKKSLHSSEE